MFSFSPHKTQLISKENTLPGREQVLAVALTHLVLSNSMIDVPKGYAVIQFGMGCFWGAERRFWQQDGVYSTAAGYAGGYTKNPLYEEVCSGLTAHTEVVKVVYKDSDAVLENLLKVFWEAHDPTQGMRQGNDVGTQYRSAIYCDADQLEKVQASREAYQKALKAKGFSGITTEIKVDVPFYFAEDYHQQYLAKNPNGYCGLRGTGVSCD